jgi:hypothetical protein
MARMRTVKPSLRTSRVVARWRFEIRYFWVLLWGYLDDEGRGLDLPKAISGDCFPLDDNVTPATVDRWLAVMATATETDRHPPLCRYQVGGVRYLHAVNWGEHQKPNRPRPSTLPSCTVHEPLSEPLGESFSEPVTELLNGSSRRSQVLELEGLRVRGLEGDDGAAVSEPPAPEPEPPDRCRDHRDDPDPPACRRCRDVRQRHEAWLAGRRTRVAAEPGCGVHPGEIAANCRCCAADRKAA